jgi:Tol biopolymer transport system component
MVRLAVLAAGLTLLAAQQVADVGRTDFQLASIGSDGVAATTTTWQPALSSDGAYTAFASTAQLTVGAEVPQHSIEGSAQLNRVYVRGRLTGITTLLSDSGTDASAPSVSGNGRTVAYETTDLFSDANQIDIVDRQSTGKGPFDTPANLTLRQVTDNPGDPRYQRLLPCPVFSGTDGGSACGPQISADGSTLAYSAVLSPVSPDLQVSIDGGPIAIGNVIDMVPGPEEQTGGVGFDVRTVTVRYTNRGQTPITFTGPPTVVGPFGVGPFICSTESTQLPPGQFCTTTITFNGDAHCTGLSQTTLDTGDLLTNATTPAGQTAQQLVVTCQPHVQVDLQTNAARPNAAPNAAGCATQPTGLPVVPAPESTNDNQTTQLVDLGPNEIGRPLLESVPISGTGRFDFLSPDCSIQLVNAQPGACRVGQILGGTSPTGCFAYLLVNPQQVATRAALIAVTNDNTGALQATYVAATGQQSVVVARQGQDFQQGSVVSLDSNGIPVPGANEPRLSTTGHFVAFAADGQIWRHEANGSTVLVSCLSTTDCPPSGEPSMSGDGTMVAFVASNQVYVRNVTTAITQLVANKAQNPAISQDGSTVAYLSNVANAQNLYLANLSPPSTELIAPNGVSLPGNTIIDLPAIDAHGRIVAMTTNAQLLPSAPPNVISTYTFERFDQLQATPAIIGYGRLIAGLPGQTRTVTVTDTGLGPTTVIGTGISGPFLLSGNTCQGIVLHHGQSCILTVLFTPTTAGTPTGRVTLTTQADGEPPSATNVGLNANVVVPTIPLMKVSPTVGYGGQVVRATGVAFPANLQLVLTWNHGLGTTTVTTDSAGGFTANLVLFPDDLLGERALLAVDPTGATLATLPFLVEASPQEPPFHKAPGAP